MEYITKDSGKHAVYESGMKRDTAEGKGAYELISPIALRRLAQLLERGAVKYEARNWEKGSPMSRLMQSTIRHLFQYLEGARDEDHLAAGMWGCMAMIHHEDQINKGNFPSALMDLPDYTIKPQPPTESPLKTAVTGWIASKDAPKRNDSAVVDESYRIGG